MDVVDEWQFALDAAAEALEANSHTFPPDELVTRRRKLAAERAEVELDLRHVVHDGRPWLSPFPLHPSLLGVPESTRACIFDLEGVLTNGGALHAAAWADVFDDLLLRLTESTGWHFVPFDRVGDYATYLEGRPRLEGIQLFLESRGIQVPRDGARDLARRKGEALGRHLHDIGVNALPGAHTYLVAAGRAHLARAVVSSSTRTLPMLKLAGLDHLVEARVDAEQIARGELRSRPAPDILLRACELLQVEPQAAVSFTRTADGIAAAEAAGIRVVSAARLVDLLDPRLAVLAA